MFLQNGKYERNSKMYNVSIKFEVAPIRADSDVRLSLSTFCAGVNFPIVCVRYNISYVLPLQVLRGLK